MSNFIEGTVQHIGPTQQVTDTFRKRVLIIQTTGQYPEYVSIEATQDRCEVMNSLQLGQYIKAFFNIKGSKEMKTNNKGETVAYTGISLWKFEQAGAQPQQGQPQQQGFQQQQPQQPAQMPWQQPNQATVPQPPIQNQNQQPPIQQQGFNNPPPNSQQQQSQQGYPAPGTNNNSPI